MYPDMAGYSSKRTLLPVESSRIVSRCLNSYKETAAPLRGCWQDGQLMVSVSFLNWLEAGQGMVFPGSLTLTTPFQR